jgi:hypothetical protein
MHALFLQEVPIRQTWSIIGNFRPGLYEGRNCKKSQSSLEGRRIAPGPALVSRKRRRMAY